MSGGGCAIFKHGRGVGGGGFRHGRGLGFGLVVAAGGGLAGVALADGSGLLLALVVATGEGASAADALASGWVVALVLADGGCPIFRHALGDRSHPHAATPAIADATKNFRRRRIAARSGDTFAADSSRSAWSSPESGAGSSAMPRLVQDGVDQGAPRIARAAHVLAAEAFGVDAHARANARVVVRPEEAHFLVG